MSCIEIMIRTTLQSLLLLICMSVGAQYPNPTLTSKGVDRIKKELGTASLFDQKVAATIDEIDKNIASNIDVSISIITTIESFSQQYKRNYKSTLKAGSLYQFVEEARNVNFAKEMLFKYASAYKVLPIDRILNFYAITLLMD